MSAEHPAARRCESCVFWSRHEDGSRWGDCSNAHFVGTYHEPAADAAPGTVIVEIDEGWGFYTDKDFGCIHAEVAS